MVSTRLPSRGAEGFHRKRTAAAAIRRFSRFASSSDGFGRSTRGGARRSSGELSSHAPRFAPRFAPR